MCVAIYKPEGKLISRRTLKKCFRANADGAGFAWLDDSRQAIISKGFFSFSTFWKAYREHAKKEAIIHFRWATHGAENYENCHPFPIPDGAMIHNGVISWCEPLKTDPRSDTRVFAEDLLTGFLTSGNDPHEAKFKATLENVLGPSNKVCMFYKGKPVILNEDYGQWIDGVWFSNTYWKWESVSWSFGDSCKTYTFKQPRTAGFALPQPPATTAYSGTELDPLYDRQVQQLWDEEDGPYCDSCQLPVASARGLIQVDDELVCQECFVELGSWQEDLRKADRDAARRQARQDDDEHNSALFRRYYQKYGRDSI